MAGLVPAIHAFLCSQDVDARHKAGHDEEYELVMRKMLYRRAAKKPRSRSAVSRSLMPP